MRRERWIWIAVALTVAVFVLSIAQGVGLRDAPSGEVLSPSIADLVWQTASYEAKQVRVTGHVRGFALGTTGEHYVVEDAEQNRVEIKGIPQATIAASVNRRMTIEGEFHFKDGVGRYLDVTSWGTPAVKNSD